MLLFHCCSNPRPRRHASCSGLYMALALLLAASQIILPIIWSEGLRAVFLPVLAPKPVEGIRRVQSVRKLSSNML